MENIRITSGNLRGRVIKSPRSSLTHPMGSREKIALFNMIAEYLPDADVLDAYAGSGALGVEAYSRGAKSVDFIEKNYQVAQTLIINLGLMEIKSANIDILAVEKFKTTKDYNIIIADPPYDNFSLKAIINLTKYLKNGGILVLSHPAPTPEISGLKLTKSRKYAKANISIYEKTT